jgi:hypothetical protein
LFATITIGEGRVEVENTMVRMPAALVKALAIQIRSVGAAEQRGLDHLTIHLSVMEIETD